LNGQDFDNEDIESRVQAEREANEVLEKSINDNFEAEEDVKTGEDEEPADDDVGQDVPETRESSAPPAKQPAHAKDQAEKVIQAPVDLDAPGEMGRPVKLDNADPETKKLIDKGWQDNAFNQYASDLISLHRTLPDQRDPWCSEPGRNLPTSSLPSSSVIICFHNEAWSALLRTVHSVLDRTPPELLHEIILVDDASTQEHLQEKLEKYISEYPAIKLVRAKERTGLIRARLLGAARASGKVLTYLDSHCECSEGWLEPLLDRIARNKTNVVCPVIDIISDESLQYQKSTYLAVGGFDWNLVFNWHGVPAREKSRRSHAAEPVHSPTMAGGLFAIDREFFERLGTYDSGFDIWGGENLELSFKTWMCGGTLEIVPCSHVGHIFRKRSPYKWRSGVNVLKKNTVRLAEVWLDEYKTYYYDRIGHKLGDFGDVASRKKLREDLQCKTFGWYLDNVFPELFVPGKAISHGEVRNLFGSDPSRQMCLDSTAKKANHNKPLGLYPCHKQGGNQYWMMSKTGEIRRDETCLDYGQGTVILYSCHGGKGNQEWEWVEWGGLLHPTSGKCMALNEKGDGLVMEECAKQNLRQHWQLENYNNSSS